MFSIQPLHDQMIYLNGTCGPPPSALACASLTSELDIAKDVCTSPGLTNMKIQTNERPYNPEVLKLKSSEDSGLSGLLPASSLLRQGPAGAAGMPCPDSSASSQSSCGRIENVGRLKQLLVMKLAPSNHQKHV